MGRKAVVMTAVAGLIYSLAIDGVYTYLSDYLRNYIGLSVRNVGLLIAFAMAGRVAGAIVIGWVAVRIGNVRGAWIAIALTSLGCAAIGCAGDLRIIVAGAFIFVLAYGCYSTVYSAIAMDLSEPRILASMFAIFMLFVNMGASIGQAVRGMIVTRIGFQKMVLVMGAINLINVLLIRGSKYAVPALKNK